MRHRKRAGEMRVRMRKNGVNRLECSGYQTGKGTMLEGWISYNNKFNRKVTACR